MRQEKAETEMTRLDKKWPKLKRREGPKYEGETTLGNAETRKG